MQGQPLFCGFSEISVDANNRLIYIVWKPDCGK